MYVTLHGVSGNKVNAHTRHVITRSHANGLTYLPWRYAHKNNRFGKGVRSHSSYLANTLSSFVSLTDQLILYNPAHFVSCVCQLLNCENGICEVYYSQNIVENKDLLRSESCNFKRNIHGKSRLFSSGFSQGIQSGRRIS